MAAYNEGGEWLDALRKYLRGNYEYLCCFFKERSAASLITQASTTILLPALIRPLRPNTKLMLDAVLMRGVLK